MGVLLVLVPLLLATLSYGDRNAMSSISRPRQHLLGADSCTWGPSFWCGHVKNAKSCSAMDHCTKTVWLKQAEPQDASAECIWCDDLMDDIKDLMRTNTSKTALRGYLKDGCKRHPTPDARVACLENISMYIREVKLMLESGVPDRTVCKAIGFCGAPQRDLPKPKTEIAARNTCLDCYNFFDDAKEIFLGNYTEDEFKAMLIQQCDQAGYPAITDLCKMVIEQNWPQIYSRLKIFFDPEQICYQITFCNDTKGAKKNLGGMPWSTLTSSRNKGRSQPQQLPTDRMLLNFGSIFPQTSPAKHMTKNAKGEWTDVKCVVCEFVMSYLDKLLEDNYTEASIQSALDKVCHVMPATVRDECQGFVDQYAPAILVILGNELDPAQVCQGLQLCNAGGDKKKTLDVAFCGTATCETCTEVFQAIKTMFESYEEANRIADLIKSTCVNFPAGKIRDQCETAVVTYVPYVMQIAATLMEPDQVCHAFKMCKA